MNEAAGTSADPEDELARLLPALWRAVVRATRTAERLPALPESQVSALRKLVARGPLAPAQLAAELDLARPTISNLVRELTAEGLIERRPSDTDGRSALLVPTERARNVLAAFRRGRGEVMARALAGIPTDDRDRLVAALPSCRRLLERLQTMPENERPDGAPAPTNRLSRQAVDG